MQLKSVLHQPALWIVLAALAIPSSYAAFAADDDAPRRGKRRNADGDRPRARQMDDEGRGRRGGPGGGPLRGLDLSEDQQKEVRTIMKGLHKKHKETREANREAIEEIDRQIKELHEKKRKLMGGGPDGLVDALDEVLTDDQLAQLKENIEKMKQRHKGDRGNRGQARGRRMRGGDGEDGDRPLKRRPRRRDKDAPEADL